MDYSRGDVQFWRHICSGAYAYSVECTHASGCGHSLHCLEFTWGRYSDIVVSCALEVIGICCIYVAFEVHIFCEDIYAYSLIKLQVHCLVWLICAVMWHLCVDYITTAVGLLSDEAGIYVHSICKWCEMYVYQCLWDIVDSSEFTWSIYTYKVVWYLDMN